MIVPFDFLTAQEMADFLIKDIAQGRNDRALKQIEGDNCPEDKRCHIGDGWIDGAAHGDQSI